ncbi:MAG: hypothetical protein K0R51_1407 [Cytophagaceae bacterium]|nr:hypothetical protein [Cytophagaceae bacterium]
MNSQLLFKCIFIAQIFISTSCANKTDELLVKINSYGFPTFNVTYETGDDGTVYNSLQIDKKEGNYSAIEVITCDWDSTVNDTLTNNKLNSQQIEYCRKFIVHYDDLKMFLFNSQSMTSLNKKSLFPL